MKSKILSNLFDEKYGFKLGEFNNTTGTERVNLPWGNLETQPFTLKPHLQGIANNPRKKVNLIKNLSGWSS